MTKLDELQYFFMLSSNFNKERRGGEPQAIDEAEDELEVFLLHADSPKLRARASALLAAA
ncbi:hypothetical protein [Thioclava nitratireducens]|uniref:hypothetical protein n=1 Tax=Thioclava nitratireducens TaxID=1915078 RepID=UPI0024811CF1|nr:hypothetical protein [Thioclava nitratireducens]WGT48912.1 hypothetical protein P0N61_11295 [Thioclava nitratireducens]